MIHVSDFLKRMMGAWGGDEGIRERITRLVPLLVKFESR